MSSVSLPACERGIWWPSCEQINVPDFIQPLNWPMSEYGGCGRPIGRITCLDHPTRGLVTLKPKSIITTLPFPFFEIV